MMHDFWNTGIFGMGGGMLTVIAIIFLAGIIVGYALAKSR